MELISYALDFSSFLIQNIKNLEGINSIILFGSVARGEAKKESDVDIFIDLLKFDKKIEKEIQDIKEKFFDSVKYKKYWKIFGIENEINIAVGELDKWPLKDSMVGNSIILYQKYSPTLKGGKNKIILSWISSKNNSHRVMLNKRLFGYNHYGKRYQGMLQKLNGEKIGNNIILIPAEFLNEFLKLFRTSKITVKIRRIVENQ